VRVEWIRIAGLAIVVLVTLICSVLIVKYDFPAFEYARASTELIEVEATPIGPKVSQFLWTYRLIDLIAQAFVLFAAATCCVALLSVEERK
jgi:ABC-type Fe3+-siderophore transport system permease subunit